MKRIVCGVYMVVNGVNGKRYIGSAKNIQARWGTHLCYLRKGNHHSRPLQFAWQKYGEAAFTLNTLEECSAETRAEREQWYLDSLKPEYNIVKVVTRPDERLRTPENEAKRLAALRAPEVQARLAEARRNVVRTPEWLANMSAAQRGKPRTHKKRAPFSKEKLAEIGKKVGDSNRGKPKNRTFSVEDLKKLGQRTKAWQARLTPEQKAEQQARLLAAALTPEARERQRASANAAYAARPQSEKDAILARLAKIREKRPPRTEASRKNAGVSIRNAFLRRKDTDAHRAVVAAMRKLTPENVRDIRTEYAAGGASLRALGRKHGVSKPTISKCVNGTYPIPPAP